VMDDCTMTYLFCQVSLFLPPWNVWDRALIHWDKIRPLISERS
jgi:hypothetical protein